MDLNGKVVLVTGGTGSFGKKFTETVLGKFKLKKLIIFSRDEFKQHEMAKIFPGTKYPIRFFLGDVRDKDRLCRAFENVDCIVHAAALKQVPALEYNPLEAVKTNVLGADNIVDAALDRGVQKVIALSSDKAVNPINLYGATKLVAEKIFIDANAYGGNRVKFSIVRYGNVMASRGSVIEFFLALKQQGIKEFPITDEAMTRFWMTLEDSVNLVITAIKESEGGEIFVPQIPSMKITDLARAIMPSCMFKKIGIRPGEKMHERLVSCDEARHTKIFNDLYVILPQFFDERKSFEKYGRLPMVPEGFSYTSDTNQKWLSVEDLRKTLTAV
ncbi:MAG: UDP-N-acetylglucosamine 4,6-dehydratase (inverting) [Candidatus Omnitrophica bacterium]|nr:UDP-N-acetylglucosamine 4,6-dehydratase (inverting) [Candidatus Omnitrophota bacterium]MBU1808949.1 UDP-N-acetylglucosamine 4,6-dehydratase (inverting) [Candidatus Omnitrophota bacterium]